MSLFSGKLSVRTFEAAFPHGTPLATVVEALNARGHKGKVYDAANREAHGWIRYTDVLGGDIQVDDYQMPYLLFAVRVDTRKVNPAVLKAQMARRVAEFVAAEDIRHLSKEMRAEIREEVEGQLLPHTPATPRHVPVDWNLSTGALRMHGTADMTQRAMLGLFHQTFGQVPRRRHLGADGEALDGGKFLRWLWMESDLGDGVISGFPATVLVGDRVRIGVVGGGRRIDVRGSAVVAPEARAVVPEGDPDLLGVGIRDGNTEWWAMIHEDLSLRGVQLPQDVGTGLTRPESKIRERLVSLDLFQGHVDALVELYTARQADPTTRDADGWRMQAWIQGKGV